MDGQWEEAVNLTRTGAPLPEGDDVAIEILGGRAFVGLRFPRTLVPGVELFSSPPEFADLGVFNRWRPHRIWSRGEPVPSFASLQPIIAGLDERVVLELAFLTPLHHWLGIDVAALGMTEFETVMTGCSRQQVICQPETQTRF